MAFKRTNFRSLLRTIKPQHHNRPKKSLKEVIATKRSQLNVTIAMIEQMLKITDLEENDKVMLDCTINYMQKRGYKLLVDLYNLAGEPINWSKIPR